MHILFTRISIQPHDIAVALVGKLQRHINSCNRQDMATAVFSVRQIAVARLFCGRYGIVSTGAPPAAVAEY